MLPGPRTARKWKALICWLIRGTLGRAMGGLPRALAACVLLAGCQASPTGLRMHVYSDVAQLEEIQVRIEPVLDDGGVVMPYDAGVPGAVGIDRTFEVRAPGAPPDDLRAPIPLVIGIAPFDGLGSIDARAVHIEVTATATRCVLGVSRVRRFVPDRIQDVYVELTERCCDVQDTCPEGYVCGFTGCEPDDPNAPLECSATLPESCNGRDDDCDPNVDEGTLSCGTGVCANEVPLCTGGARNVCTELLARAAVEVRAARFAHAA